MALIHPTGLPSWQGGNMLNQISKFILALTHRSNPAPSKIKEQLEMLDNLLAVIPGHLYWTDRNGLYLGCNNQQAISAGLHSRKDIIGKSNQELPWNFNAGQLPESLDEINKQVIRTNKPIIIEEPAILQNGTEAIFLSNKVPLHNNRGQV